MKAVIVLAHEGESSFCHEILARVTQALDKQNIEYKLRDLYKMQFQPVFQAEDMRLVEQGTASADILEEQELIKDSELLIMIYPVWWWSEPAILKGYIDRVFTDGFAFRYEEKGPVGLLTNKQAIVFTTTRASAKEMATSGMDAVVEKQIAEGTLQMIGYRVAYHNFAAVPYVEDGALINMLKQVEERMLHIRQPVGV
ncbi:NAD(P)H-dependent oxidoreductase [Brevibacillus choshinensis]|uniref:NAD(P)H dehydrogenase n=1 Tax=Brevibacillus choshinensis TaxID=54911 RepID=A0ABR5NBS6_BRECH|nr:NAD(P)H-dependent oxidoreductase [Brevibacillus choshinensis]KQL49011.1 NAD(P)H dehydrogenase [Brevibacillus choshinensis]MED4751392.1 NAD(P)H-dependent oxidoreductase [Brevibacillus choshinensis]MED4783574.1 NAD(P)H-dependent oxidoreductase [Brevibacillus choshinensis]